MKFASRNAGMVVVVEVVVVEVVVVSDGTVVVVLPGAGSGVQLTAKKATAMAAISTLLLFISLQGSAAIAESRYYVIIDTKIQLVLKSSKLKCYNFSMDKNTKNKEYYGWAVACLIGLVFIFFMAYSTGNNQQASTPTTSTNTPQYSSSSSYAYPSVPAQAPTRPKGSCKDVTSYDYNWNNDMLCTRPDGTTFYTNYQGARDYLSTQ